MDLGRLVVLGKEERDQVCQGWAKTQALKPRKPALMPLSVESQCLLTAALWGTHCVPTPVPALEPLGPSWPAAPPQAPSGW